MFAHAFMRHAFLAGSLIALASGLLGYFVVLRSQVFAGDALSHVAFTGALAAAAIGADLRIGLFTATVVVALGLGLLGPRARTDDATIGSVFAWVLGLGALFLAVFAQRSSAGDAGAGVRVLFGSIYGLSADDATVAAAVSLAVCASVLLIARPLLFASIAPAVAAARGVPVGLLGVGFLVAVGVATAQATQAVGALLALGLLAAPAGAALRLTADPYVGLALSAALALASTWIGLTAAYVVPALPPSFAIVATATLLYLLATAAGLNAERTRQAAPTAAARSSH
ncbi:MAG: metal ABC transporter permease [Actinomycetota bacterium]|nr:metal ABC transporter permease [Actinomycetota bacterium]